MGIISFSNQIALLLVEGTACRMHLCHTCACCRLLFLHVSLDGEADDFCDGIAAYGHGFLEMTGESVTAVIGDVNLSPFTWLDGGLGEGGDSASTAGKCLMNDQWSCPGVGESE